MTEDNRLSDRNHAINVRNRLIFDVLIATLDVILFDVVQDFFLLLQSDGDGRWNDELCKFHDLLVVRGAKQHHLAFLREILVQSYALILMTLLCNHHVGFVQNENANL